jgi:hypothetical protein
MSDSRENLRRERLIEINTDLGSRESLEQRYGLVWSTAQLTENFTVIGFLAPYVAVRRKSDGVRGTLEFQHQPRFYFNFQPE